MYWYNSNNNPTTYATNGFCNTCGTINPGQFNFNPSTMPLNGQGFFNGYGCLPVNQSPYQYGYSPLNHNQAPGSYGYSAWGVPANRQYTPNASHTTYWMPAVQITEGDANWMFAFELPGVKDQEIELFIHGNLLTIRGEKNCWNNEGRQVTRYSDAYAGPFYRQIQLGEIGSEESFDAQRVSAEFNNGMLFVTLPKTQQAKSQFKKIEIAKRTTKNPVTA